MFKLQAHMQASAVALLSLLIGAGCTSDRVGVSGQRLYAAASQTLFKGPEEHFTGDVFVQRVFPATEPSNYAGTYVHFEAGARSAWHRHPAGQHLVVTAGVAVTGTRNGAPVRAEPGDAIWCPPGVEHWHGALPDRPMTHLVITGSRKQAVVVWKARVDDATYLQAVSDTAPIVGGVDMLTPWQQALVPIAATAASGERKALAAAIVRGLDAGMTIHEARELLLHLYAYAGFPRALNGLATLMSVVEARQMRGTDDLAGESPTELPEAGVTRAAGEAVQTRLFGGPVAGPLFDFAPGANELLQRHLFGDLFARGVLDASAREIVTIAALAVMEGVAPQIQAHIRAGRNAGLSREQLQAIAGVLKQHIGRAAGERVEQAITAAMDPNDRRP